MIGANGSYARLEASPAADLDYFAICRTREQSAEAEALDAIAPDLLRIVGKAPAVGGAFGEVEDLDTMLSNIGGNDDSNRKITRRMLFLLEGDWLSNKDLFNEVFDATLDKYVRSTTTAHQLALFLLNDFILTIGQSALISTTRQYRKILQNRGNKKYKTDFIP